MSASACSDVAEPRVLHSLPGRLRVQVPGGSERQPGDLEARLRRIPGVQSVKVSPRTGNALIRFDPRAASDAAILAELSAAEGAPARRAPTTGSAGREARAPRPSPSHVVHDRRRGVRRVRVPVCGMDRDPRVAKQVVERLRAHPGVRRASASALTGRVLIEFAERKVDLEDLLADVVDVELPALAGEDRPAHPLDPTPLIQSTTQTAGAGLGLGLLAARRLIAAGEPLPGASAAAQFSAAVGLVRSFPVTREGLRRLLGRHVADLFFNVAGIVSLALSDSPLGLAVNTLEGLRLLTEVLARRGAFQRLEEDLAGAPEAEPGAVVRLESGERPSRPARIVEGAGTATGHDGLPRPVGPGDSVRAGGRLYGGPFVVELQGHDPFEPEPRPAAVAPTLYNRYLEALGPFSLGYAAVAGIATRSFSRAFQALLLVNPRPALIGKDAADTGASARVLRAGVTVVGTRPERVIRRPDVLLIDGPHVLTDGAELTSVLPQTDAYETSEILGWAAGLAAACGYPWGGAFRAVNAASATEGRFTGRAVSGLIDGVRYSLEQPEAGDEPPAARRLRERGEWVLLLRREGEHQPLAVIALRPRLRAGCADLVAVCRRHGVDLGVIARGDPAAARAVARRADIPLATGHDSHNEVEIIRAHQREGKLVAFVSDNAGAAAAFAACDLAIGLSDGRAHFSARADLLSPDLGGVGAVVDAGALREAAVRDAVALSALANVVGAGIGFGGAPGVSGASRAVNVAALAVLADGWWRLWGGTRPRSILSRLTEPHPERWGRQSVPDLLRAFRTSEAGLSAAQAAERRRSTRPRSRQHPLRQAFIEQLSSPLTAVLAIGAGVSLVMGAAVDVAIIGATIAANVALGTWQEHQASRAAEALAAMGQPTAQVLRDSQPATVPAREVVPGDLLLLAPGDRVAADARLIEAQGLEVDEANLTGESVPVLKAADGPTDASRVVLEGSDVTAGSGRAVVVAVGRGTRWGATAAALDSDATQQSPLGQRLSRMLIQVLPLAVAGGGIATASGLLRGQSLVSQLGIGTTLAVTSVPEGLPLLARVGEAAVARRLAGREALVRRLAAVEALGRVDVACTDKTGTLTEGRLSLSLVAGPERDVRLPAALPPDLRHVLLAGGLASPPPDAPASAAHPTDVAVVQGALAAGIDGELRQPREAELPFESARSFHATASAGRLYVKGAPEALVPRCAQVRSDDGDRPLDDHGQTWLLERAQQLAAEGLRVLMVAEGPADSPVDDPRHLVALGFLGISDPLRPAVRDAVRRCHEAGIRVIMLTGDHPATARAIGHEAGLLNGSDKIVTGPELAQLENGELDRRLERATVIARATPIDKLRIVESLQRSGHTVAMTGDGVNDAPALRLADVGVSMGRGTEVARQASDVVLATDDFASLVEALVEGRGFWRNIRRALGLLLGGNLGELGLVVGASLLGLTSPLTTRQILAVNLITDVLPGLAVALQRPEHRNLAELAREGTAALDITLRRDVMRRALSTALPSLAAHLVARPFGLAQAHAVAFGSIIASQLAQTLDAGWVEGSLSPSVLAAVAGSAAVLAGALTVPPVRALLTLAIPTPAGWALIGGAALAAVVLSRLLATARLTLPEVPVRRAIPAAA